MARGKTGSSGKKKKASSSKNRTTVVLTFKGIGSIISSKLIGLVKSLAVGGRPGKPVHNKAEKKVVWKWSFPNTVKGIANMENFVKCARDNKFGKNCNIAIKRSEVPLKRKGSSKRKGSGKRKGSSGKKKKSKKGKSTSSKKKKKGKSTSSKKKKGKSKSTSSKKKKGKGKSGSSTKGKKKTTKRAASKTGGKRKRTTSTSRISSKRRKTSAKGYNYVSDGKAKSRTKKGLPAAWAGSKSVGTKVKGPSGAMFTIMRKQGKHPHNFYKRSSGKKK